VVRFNKVLVYSKPTLFIRNLYKDKDSQDRKDTWLYWLLISILNYLASTTRPDIIFAIH